jgi:cobalt-zinc-cadmium efflux system membrane fusion protein
MKLNTATLIALLILLSACKDKISEEHQKEFAASSAAEIIAANDLKTGTIKPEVISKKLKVTGILEAPPQSTAQVFPVIGAFVKEVYVIKGQKVDKGERLAVLYHPDILDIQKRYISANIELDHRKKDYTRKTKLAEREAVSEKQLQASEAAFYSTQSEVRSLESILRSLGLNPEDITKGNLRETVYLLAPISGHILDTRAGVGQYAGNDAPLFTVVSKDHLHLELQLPASNVGLIRKGMKLEFEVRTHDAPLPGEIYLVNQVADESGFFTAHAHIDDSDSKLRPGTYAEAAIFYELDTLPALPRSAVWEEGAKAYVLVVENDELVKTSVTPGGASDDHIAILDYQNLTGKKMVLSGVKYLLAEPDEGHSH